MTDKKLPRAKKARRVPSGAAAAARKTRPIVTVENLTQLTRLSEIFKRGGRKRRMGVSQGFTKKGAQCMVFHLGTTPFKIGPKNQVKLFKALLEMEAVKDHLTEDLTEGGSNE